MLKSDGWFVRMFPTLAHYPADKWVMIPMTFFLSISVLIGVVTAIFENPDKVCNPCHDPQMKSYDEYLCTGKVGPTGSFEKQLAACRKKLGKPEAY
jgi:hypothetical protein